MVIGGDGPQPHSLTPTRVTCVVVVSSSASSFAALVDAGAYSLSLSFCHA